MAPSFREKPQGIPQDFRQIVFHEKCFVFVDRDTVSAEWRSDGSSTMRRRPLPTPALATNSKRVALETAARILEVHRVDRVIRHRHFQARRADQALVVEADEAREPPSRASFDNAVEINKEDRFSNAIGVRHTSAQSSGDEGEMRIGHRSIDGVRRGFKPRAALDDSLDR